MRDAKLSDVEERMRAKIDKPDEPNNISGSVIFSYKLYLSLLAHIVRLDKEIELLQKGGI